MPVALTINRKLQVQRMITLDISAFVMRVRQIDSKRTEKVTGKVTVATAVRALESHNF